MTLIFELINSAGKVLERNKVSGEKISIGRAYDNDVILTNLSVSPHHASVSTDAEGQIYIHDLQSENGIRDTNNSIIQANKVVASGDIYLFGNARLRIFKTDHPIEDTLSLNGFNTLIEVLGRPLVLVSVFFLLISLKFLGAWLTSYDDFKWNLHIQTTLYEILAIVCLALFWALVGRIAKHEMFFKVQLTVIILYFCIEIALTFLHEIFLFNTLNYNLSTVFNILVGLAFFAILFWINIFISTNQSNTQRWGIAVSLAAVMILFSFSEKFLTSDQFSIAPKYIAEVKPPIFKINSGEAIASFIKDSDAIYSHEIEE